MKFTTFNIRCDHQQDGTNNFVYRKPLILDEINKQAPDIICFQEVLPHVAAWLKENLTDYYIIGCGRDEALDGEQVSIAYRKDRYNLAAMETFWLSDTPYKPGSRYAGQSNCARVAALAVFAESDTGRTFRVANTHLDHLSAYAREHGLAQILDRLEHPQLFPDAPVILAGDFNAEPQDAELKVFDRYEGYQNVAAGIGYTFHSFQGRTRTAIDYIYIRGAVTCRGVEKWTREENSVYLSDHFPVCAELEWA